MEKELLKIYTQIKKGELKSNKVKNKIIKTEGLIEHLREKTEFLDFYYKDPTILQRLRYLFEFNEIEFCSCGEPRSWRNFIKGYNKTCGSLKCSSDQNTISRKEFYQKKYGVDHFFITEEFKSKYKSKMIEKYGVDNPSKSKEVIDKIKNTNKIRYGEDSWLKIEGNKKKLSEKIAENHRTEREKKIKESNIEIEILDFNVRNATILCKNCNNKYQVSSSFFNKKISVQESPCLTCNPLLNGSSKSEIELLEFLKSIYNGKIINNDRKILEGKEIDIYLPELNIAFEFEGIYWHSEIFKGKNGNLEKKEIIRNKGIKIYNIWEDNWCYKKEITKSRIKNIFGLSQKIYARNCTIQEVSTAEEKKFLNENHIQGYVPSKIKLGLFLKDKMVSIMTFGKKRKSLGQSDKEREYELLRFCNSLNIHVVGGASKIFSKFIKDYSPEVVISYQDNSWDTGELYKKIGFNLVQNQRISPGYWWCKGNIRFHRFNFRKDKLIKDGFDPEQTENQIMTKRGYFKLWDFGNLKWEYKKKDQIKI